MNKHNVTAADLDKMQQIARVSSWTAGKRVWTELALYSRPGHVRPYVAVVEGRVAPGAVSEQDQRPLVPRFKAMTAGTLDRAFNWFESSELRDRLAEAIPEDYAAMITLNAPPVDQDKIIKAVGDAIVSPKSFDDGFSARLRGDPRPSGRMASFGWDVADTRIKNGEDLFGPGAARIPRLCPGNEIPMRIVGYDGPDTLASALAWLYPKKGEAIGYRMEEDFGMPARTVRHALSVERGDTPGKPAPWIKMFITTLRNFDRELWMAGKSAKAGTAE